MVLKEFLDWSTHKISYLQKNGLTATLTIGEDCPNQSARLDIESEHYMARITIWESGDCHCEIIDLMNEKTVFDKMINVDLIHQESFESTFDDFFKVLL